MKYALELYKLKYAIMRADSGLVYLINLRNNEPVGFLNIEVEFDFDECAPVTDTLRRDLLDTGDSISDECASIAVYLVHHLSGRRNVKEIYRPFSLGALSHWVHLDYCFIKKKHRGRGLGHLFLRAYMEQFAKRVVFTAITENGQPGLFDYWSSMGFKLFAGRRKDGPMYTVQGGSVSDREVRILKDECREYRNSLPPQEEDDE